MPNKVCIVLSVWFYEDVMQLDRERRWNTVWVVGASSGIGRELALAMAPKCRKLWVSARREPELLELTGRYENISVLPMDITNQDQVAEAAKKIEQEIGGDSAIDLVVISSAVGLMSKIPKFDPQMYRLSMEINYMGTVNVMAAVLPAMVAAQSGHIAMISSVAGYRGLPNGAPYAPTKAALINLAECIYPQLKRLGVTLSVINPGFVETPMTENNKFPMPFLMKPDQAARRIVKGLEKKRYEIAFPLRMAWLLKLIRILPNAVFFWLADKLMLGKKRR
jgi:short-subunit dehydrogenase